MASVMGFSVIGACRRSLCHASRGGFSGLAGDEPSSLWARARFLSTMQCALRRVGKVRVLMGDIISMVDGCGGVPVPLVLDLRLQRIESGQMRISVPVAGGSSSVFDTACKLDRHGLPCQSCFLEAASLAFAAAVGNEAAKRRLPVDTVFDVVCLLNGVPFLPDWQGGL